jgi:hypothetical protein
MKTLGIDELPALPREIKALVHQGVYSLYAVRNVPAAFLLLTKNRNEFYFLSAAGDVIGNPGLKKVDDADVIEALTFAESVGSETARINYR